MLSPRQCLSHTSPREKKKKINYLEILHKQPSIYHTDPNQSLIAHFSKDFSHQMKLFFIKSFVQKREENGKIENGEKLFHVILHNISLLFSFFLWKNTQLLS